MKKLITLAFVITALLLGAIAIQAQPHHKKHKRQTKVFTDNNYGYDTNYRRYNTNYRLGYYNGYYNRKGVYVFYKQKRVWKYGQMFKNTYKIKLFPNGRKKVKLVSSVPVQRRYGKRVFYRTRIVQRGWKTYRVTYKIIRFQNGRVKKKVVNKVRIYNHYPVNW